MKNRFSSKVKTLCYALCFLSICGASYSCSDDYDLDEKLPEDMGNGGIYDQLKQRGFNTVVRLIDDLGYATVFSTTGSKTIFAADDAAWERFFATTSWTDGLGNPIRSYDQLSVGQKKVLFKNAMLDNAYVLEMLANATINGALSKNQCLRQGTAFDAVDTIPYWKPADLPALRNAIDETGDNAYTSDLGWWNNTDFWGVRNQQSSRMTYMAVDGTSGMMTHFLERNMKEKSIARSDVAFMLFGDRNAWTESDGDRSYIYDRQVTTQDIVCKNGYIHVLDEVLVPPTNMAETIRQTPETSYFSAMLDRFSAPYPDLNLTNNYNALHELNGDTVFVKLYLSENGRNLAPYTTDKAPFTLQRDPAKNPLSNETPRLPYDPGWNQYAVSTTISKEQDMAAMFVPSNEAMWNYFTQGQGVTLMDRFASELPVTRENFLENLYQIPLSIMRSLINNLMKNSFVETVPSKWKTIMNDAQDQMFPPVDYSEDAFYGVFDKVLLANNGVVYVMNKLIAPADFASVIGPALYTKNAHIMNALLTADENAGVEDAASFENSPLQQYYSIYLKAMQSHFTLFIPSDEGLREYGLVDPFAYSVGNSSQQRRFWRFWSFEYKQTKQKGKYLPIQMRPYLWNPDAARNIANTNPLTGNGFITIQNTTTTSDGAGGELRKYLLTEMVDQHIIVHEKSETEGVLSTPNWYLSREGAPVFINKKTSENYSEGMEVAGGLQLWLNNDSKSENDELCTVTKGFDQTGKLTGYGNGMSYIIDRPMQPTIHSVYHILKDKEEYSRFFQMCEFDRMLDALKNIGFNYLKPDSAMSEAEWQRESRKFLIFRGEENNYYTPNGEKLVRFFNNYNYTIYLPTNAAIQDAVNHGLPTWEDIEAIAIDIESINTELEKLGEPQDPDPDEEKRAALVEQRWSLMKKGQAMATCLLNFLKYHYQDCSVFVDNVDGTATGDYQTSCIDSEANNYVMLHVARNTGSIAVTDNSGAVVKVNTADAKQYNMLANDIQYSKRNNAASGSNLGHIRVNSYVVMHQLANDTYLNFLSKAEWAKSGNRFDSSWATTDSARRFVNKYRIRK